MEYLNSFTNTNMYNSNKPSLNEKENYAVYLKDKKMIEVKSSSSSSYVIFETNHDCIIHILTNENERIAVELTKGVNKIDNVFYGYDIINNDGYSTNGITSIDISHLIVDNLKTVNGLFNDFDVKDINLGNLSFDKLTDMSSMFSNCISLTSLDLSNFNTSKVTDMNSMFSNCSGLTSLDLSNFDTSKVTDMNSMFSYCTNLTSLDLSNFDTSKVTNMNDMFGNCIDLTSLDLSKFNTSNVTDMSYMFGNCDSLMYIKCTHSFKNWCIANQGKILLPQAMREGGNGTWKIVDSKS